MKHILVFLSIATLCGCRDNPGKMTNSEETENTSMAATDIPDPGEWTVLFDGTSFDGWKGYLRDDIPEYWKLEDGAMVLYPPDDPPEGESYNLVTVNNYSSFILSLEWKISEGGNSGFFWGIKEDEKYKQPYETGPEIQVLDNERHPDAKAGTTHQAGALYDMVAPSRDVTKPVGEWNTCILTVDLENEQGNVVLNGVRIVDFPLANDLWDAMVSESKFADWDGFGKFTNGKIGLQDHGDKVSFRNIKIKQL